MKTLNNPKWTGLDQLTDGTDRDISLRDPGISAQPRLQMDELLRLIEQFYSSAGRADGNSSRDGHLTRTE